MADHNSNDSEPAAMASSAGSCDTNIYVQKTPRKLYSFDRVEYAIVYEGKAAPNSQPSTKEDSKDSLDTNTHESTILQPNSASVSIRVLKHIHGTVLDHRKQMRMFLATLSERNRKLENAMKESDDPLQANSLGVFLDVTKGLEQKAVRWAGEVEEVLWDVRDEMEVAWQLYIWD